MAAYSIPTGPFTGSYTVPASSSNKPSVADRVSDTARGTSTAFGVSTGVGGYIPGGVQAAQDAVAKQVQDAWNSVNQQARSVIGSDAEPSSWADPSTYTLPSNKTTGPGQQVSNPYSSTPGSTAPASTAAQQTSGVPALGTPQAAAQQQGSDYIDPAIYSIGPYVNPFGNDAQVKALNDYYNQLGNAWANWGDQAMKALQDNAVQLATTPGGMEAAKAAIEKQLSDALGQMRSTINAGVNQVINNPVPDSAWSQSSSGTPTIPGLVLPDLVLPGITPGTTPATGDTTGEGDNPAGTGDNSGVGETTGLSTTSPAPYTLPDLPGPNPERVNHVDTTELRDMLQQIVDSQTEQSNNKINYAVQQGVNELNRAMEDAAKNYQTQRNQVSADEARALDNQALYSEARGDRGGIGEAQYAAIQNAAAQNRRAVNDAQVKLGTDTARQIADLRAQGEFEKADQLLSIAQSHMSQLMNLEQWAMGTNVGVDEFNSQLQQWVDEYNLDKQKFLSDLDLSAAQLTGMFSDGTRTYEAEQALISSLANSGNAMLQMGVMPSRQQLQAMGMSQAQAQQYIAKKTSPLGVLGLI